MLLSRKTLRDNILCIWTQFRGKNLNHKYTADESPLRAELFSADQMSLHGKTMAGMHKVTDGYHRGLLLARLAENENLLLEVYDLLTEDVKADRQITPAGEWLLDNFYLIEEQIRTAKHHFPKSYSRELPNLVNGALAGYPRVYDIAQETVSHGDGRVDPENLSSFVAAYQSVAVLKLGELWAIPIMLRLALMENLRRVAVRIAADRMYRMEAEVWVTKITEIATNDPKNLILVIADMARSNPPMVSSFVAELAHHLQGQVPTLSLPLNWIEQRLSESGLTIEQMVRAENQQLAADQITISNSIGSLRIVAAMDWQEFVESMSIVEQTLIQDPADVYGKMDFATRDRYRHVIEKIARRSNCSEIEVTQAAILLAQSGAKPANGDDRISHVGFFLIDKGIAQLNQALGVHLSLFEQYGRFKHKYSSFLYIGSILILTAFFTGCLAMKAYEDGLRGWALDLMVLLLFLGTGQLAVSLVNWIATMLSKPLLLPRMDFSKGIPADSRTLVIVPTMLTSVQNIEDLFKALEIRFLANQDDNLHFGLLTDYRDSDTETLPEDEALLLLAGQRIADLNEQYNRFDYDTFFLFHRPRRWNPRENIWMGYERKRGKLSDLNRLLQGGSKESFSHIEGDVRDLAGVKYIITLDTDTQLVRDSARQFIGTMAHPLNQPYYNETRKRVTSGYGILQPRVSVSLPGANRSLYARMGASEPGIDPYTRSVSDVYQDLFEEGSFIGKGIYDIEAFEQALAGRFPENRILSHDLLEGSYARAGLLSDVQLYEEVPSTYSADVNRRHRWIRGDWQIAQWVMPVVPDADGHYQKNPLSFLSRWKIFDNLRRSLTSAALTVLLLVGWIALPASRHWTLTILSIIIIPPLAAAVLNLLRKPVDVSVREHLANEMRSVHRSLYEILFTIVCLPYEAYYSLDAMIRTIWRMLITHRHLLEWKPSGEAVSNSDKNIITTYRIMWFAPLLSLATMTALVLWYPIRLEWAAFVLLLWFVSPVVVWWISRPLAQQEAKLSAEQITFLRKLSRKTWSFFETFVTEEHNWLPPDNFQEHPTPVTAHRTSPTNMGLALLANLSAYDFGMISSGKLLQRSSQALQTMQKLEKYYGHFFNWYDTQTLNALNPIYISSVDSGNLAGHLMTLQNGLLGLSEDKIIGKHWLDSLSDTLGILADITSESPEPHILSKLEQLRRNLDSKITSLPATLITLWQCFMELEKSASEIVSSIEATDFNPNSIVLWWTRAFTRHCNDAMEELSFLAPWIDRLSEHNLSMDLLCLNAIPTLTELAGLESKLRMAITEQPGSEITSSDKEWLGTMQNLVQTGSRHAQIRLTVIDELAQICVDLSKMDYEFLYDKKRHLLSIGFDVSEHRLDSSYYDLLASEARFSSFVAIAQGKIPQENWFALGRLLTTAGGEPILLSWSGSMFEYLMPLLVMPTYENTLLDQTYKTSVARQIEYGKRRSVPWGISESGYNAIDVHLNYQYRAFGVPGLGLKRGLADDLVVAPYASVMALMVAPEEACRNLERLAADGFDANYGFYEAIDYTPSRLPRGQTHVVIKSFMAHHQGMSLLALAYLLLDRPMQKRFEADSLFQATMLLLQERIPKATAYYARTTRLAEHFVTSGASETPIRVFSTPNTRNPEVALLSNGRYHVMVTNAGGGYSRWKDLDVTRWREDRTCDNWGMFCYIRDVASSEYWSVAHQPTLKQSKHFEAIFSEGRAEFRDRDHDYDIHTEIAVSAEDDIELRRVRITNRSRNSRLIEITSYAEVVLAPHAADALHPAFSNLFVQTEILPKSKAILCTRRPRSQEEKEPWMLHLMAAHGVNIQNVSYETDRVKFIGRGNTLTNPQALVNREGFDNTALSGSEGSVLDPIVAIRCRITLEPEEVVTVNIVTGVGETRDSALSLIEKYQDRRLADRVFNLAWTHSQVMLRQFNITESDAQLYARLAGAVIYANSSLRADPGTLIKNHRGQSGLWGYAISGDLPIVLLQIEDPANIDLVRQLVQAHAYWRLKGLAVDLVIWNEDHAGYRQLLHDRIMGLIAAGIESNVTDQPGGIFVKPVDQIAEEDRILIQTVARAIIKDTRGSLAEQINGRRIHEISVPLLNASRTVKPDPLTIPVQLRKDLIFNNGLGGFTPDGREYVINTGREQITPAPWVNVLANPQFGTVISESGLSYTWSENAHEFRLTPWSNDPVGDSRGEAIYLRDEERGNYWSPSPQPSNGKTPYVTRHGFGYSVFEHTQNGIRTELWVYVALDSAIKFNVLKVYNESDRTRKLSATGYVEWVLGDLRAKSSMHVITETDSISGALFARNSYNKEFPDRTAFFDTDDTARSITCDRTEFLGRNGTLGRPAAMARSRLSGKVGAALDPCAAIQISFELSAGQEREIIFRLGIGQNASDARNLVNRFKGTGAAREALDIVWQHWSHTLGTVNVETPDLSLNVLANGWLLYQTIACRIWARSATYQSGGAFGFRDQLQDVMALIHARPHLVREHLLLSAAHQFPEGDVQHWWHPPMNRGVRTHISDDYLWLPLATSRYVLSTGDTGVLDEQVYYVVGRPLNSDEDSYYDLPERSKKPESLYQHCVKAILNSFKYGIHGLPLMGTGDWNDGMNLVGEKGEGESVWLGFFMYEVLSRFAEIARIQGDMAFAERCIREVSSLQTNIEAHGWDGEWYRRAYFDDGSPLGSAENTECQIDSIAQSWSVLSGAGNIERSRQAMESLDQRLVNGKSGIIQLLDPPFDKSAMNPGYIKGYVPGVRENGGQYTHAAIWATMAFASLGDSRRAWELFNMINPVNHAKSLKDAHVYKVEPYVVAADVYAVVPHTGRGGWTWYTGSASWMYRLIIESLLGLHLDVDKLSFAPCLPANWPGFKLHYRYRETVYHISVTQSESKEMRVTVDGAEQPQNTIHLQDDQIEHWAEVMLSIRQI